MEWWLKPHPGHFTSGKGTRYPFYRRMGGPQGRSGRVRKISPPLGFDPRTVQPVASLYTDWAIPALQTACSSSNTLIISVAQGIAPTHFRILRILVNGIRLCNSHMFRVELKSTALFLVLGLTSSWDRHAILQCFSFVLCKLLPSDGWFLNSKIKDFLYN